MPSVSPPLQVVVLALSTVGVVGRPGRLRPAGPARALPERVTGAKWWPQLIVLLHSYIVLYSTAYESGFVHRTSLRNCLPRGLADD